MANREKLYADYQKAVEERDERIASFKTEREAASKELYETAYLRAKRRYNQAQDALALEFNRRDRDVEAAAGPLVGTVPDECGYIRDELKAAARAMREASPPADVAEARAWQQRITALSSATQDWRRKVELAEDPLGVATAIRDKALRPVWEYAEADDD